MRKTLVLAVDRDDDFGTKANVVSPVIGIDGIMDAVMRLGSADPEDSDVNALLSAVNIWNDLSEDGKDVEVALLCGDKKVGHRSDTVIVDQLEQVLEEVHPDRIILVSDGAEDEFVYPIISSRVPIDSVKKVFVKQTPGLEGSLYILSRILRDDGKRRRFFAPLGWLLIVIGMFLILPDLMQFFSGGDLSVLYNSMGANMLILIFGLIFCASAYNLPDRLSGQYNYIISEIRLGHMSIIFMILSVALLLGGIILGYMAVLNLYESSFIYKFMTFISYLLWMTVFAVICYGFGKAIDDYLKTQNFNRSFILGSITVLALAFVMQAVIDILNATFGYEFIGELVLVCELLIGIGFGVCAAMLHTSFRDFYEARGIPDGEPEDADI